MSDSDTLNSAILSTGERQQYHRHLILDQVGLDGQLQLKQAKVLVIGAGGLGCPVLQYLSAAGVGTIGIMDGDVVDQTNLQRQTLYTINDIGKSKATTAAARLTPLNPYIRFEVCAEYLTTINAVSLFSNYDIIVDGSDNFPTRYLVNDACVLAQRPLVFGSIFKFQGQVAVFNYKGSGTYRCLYPSPPQSDAVPNCSEVGVLGVLPGIIGSLQANEVLKLITGIGIPLVDTLLYFDALTLQQQLLKFEKNPELHITALEDNYEVFCGVPTLDLAAEITRISALEAKKTLDRYTLLDVRTDQEYENENIGGIHIPLEELDDRFEELPVDKPILVCCSSGVRSALAITLLSEDLETITLLNLEGGLETFLSIDD